MIDTSNAFLASQDNTEIILCWFSEQIKPLNLNKKLNYHIELCLEEVIVNIINYAYTNVAGNIEIMLKTDIDQLKITVKDQGDPFNLTTEFTPPDNASSLESRAIGGLGIYFVHELMDTIEYIRENNSNILILTKSI